ncbi:MAG TPA: hypothetical protein VFZ38_04440, partial [Vicinamibacterales bacterium]
MILVPGVPEVPGVPGVIPEVPLVPGVPEVLLRLRGCFEMPNQTDRRAHCPARQMPGADEFFFGNQALIERVDQVID